MLMQDTCVGMAECQHNIMGTVVQLDGYHRAQDLLKRQNNITSLEQHILFLKKKNVLLYKRSKKNLLNNKNEESREEPPLIYG